jgi:hypothetical protein
MSKINFLLKLPGRTDLARIEADRITFDADAVFFHSDGKVVAAANRYDLVADDGVLKLLPKDLSGEPGALWHAPEAVQAVSVFSDCEPARLGSVAGASWPTVALVGVLSFLAGVGVVLGAAQFL